MLVAFQISVILKRLTAFITGADMALISGGMFPQLMITYLSPSGCREVAVLLGGALETAFLVVFVVMSVKGTGSAKMHRTLAAKPLGEGCVARLEMFLQMFPEICNSKISATF